MILIRQDLCSNASSLPSASLSLPPVPLSSQATEAVADDTFSKLGTTSLSPSSKRPDFITISPTPSVKGEGLEARGDAFEGQGVTVGEVLFYTVIASLALGAIGAAGAGIYDRLKPQRNPTPIDIPLEAIERQAPGSSQDIQNAHEAGRRDISEAGGIQGRSADGATTGALESQGEESQGGEGPWVSRR